MSALHSQSATWASKVASPLKFIFEEEERALFFIHLVHVLKRPHCDRYLGKRFCPVLLLKNLQTIRYRFGDHELMQNSEQTLVCPQWLAAARVTNK